MSEVQQVSRQQRDQLGEGPIWSARRDAVLWVDIFGQAVNELQLETGEVRRWPMPERIGWIQERQAHSNFIAGFKSGLAELNLDPFHIQHIGNPEPDRPQNRLNDSKVDSAGRIWFGSMDDSDAESSGAFYRLDSDLTWSRHDDGYRVTNGPAFSLDGTRLYHADSPAYTIYVFELAPDGSLSNRRIFLRFPEEWGYPDGMATDSEDGLWVAHWGAARISRFLPDGQFDRSIAMPAKFITSLCFAGKKLDRLFVTSASANDEDNSRAGALFEVDAGVRGVTAPLFAG